MAQIDPFTTKRLQKFVEDYRRNQGQLPTLEDFEKSGFDRELVKKATHAEVLEKFYVTLTNGTIRKGYKIKVRD